MIHVSPSLGAELVSGPYLLFHSVAWRMFANLECPYRVIALDDQESCR